MDVLTDVLAATKLGGAITACLTAGAPWGVRMAAQPVVAFHVVTGGTCWLLREGDAPLPAGPGDVLLLPTGGGHALASDTDAPLAPYDEVRGRATATSD